MDAELLKSQIPELIGRLEQDGYSDEMVQNARWVLGRFRKFVDWNRLTEVGPPEMEEFLRLQYDLELCAKNVTPAQCVVRKPLLELWEFANTGAYRKSRQGEKHEPPLKFASVHADYEDFVGDLDIAESTARGRLLTMRRFPRHLAANGVQDIADLVPDDVYGFLDDGHHSAHSLKRDSYHLREALEWVRGRGTIGFGGCDASPAIKARPLTPVPSYYTSSEVARMLAAIDTSTAEGKRDMLVMSLLAHHGMRRGDVAKLEVGNVDWASGTIGMIQGKTKLPLTLPLIDEAKCPLIDHLKNARPESDGPHVLLTTYAPVTCHKGGSALHRIVAGVMGRAGIDFAGRRRGGHALRHSLASSMLEEKVPLPTIGGVLGHADTGTTEAHLSIDERRLASIALEVPHVGRAWERADERKPGRADGGVRRPQALARARLRRQPGAHVRPHVRLPRRQGHGRGRVRGMGGRARGRGPHDARQGGPPPERFRAIRAAHRWGRCRRRHEGTL